MHRRRVGSDVATGVALGVVVTTVGVVQGQGGGGDQRELRQLRRSKFVSNSEIHHVIWSSK